jgi:hypothetical protein
MLVSPQSSRKLGHDELMRKTAVFDTLAQHNPEWVSLAWGAFKFFFIVSHGHPRAVSGDHLGTLLMYTRL